MKATQVMEGGINLKYIFKLWILPCPKILKFPPTQNNNFWLRSRPGYWKFAPSSWKVLGQQPRHSQSNWFFYRRKMFMSYITVVVLLLLISGVWGCAPGLRRFRHHGGNLNNEFFREGCKNFHIKVNIDMLMPLWGLVVIPNNRKKF